MDPLYVDAKIDLLELMKRDNVAVAQVVLEFPARRADHNRVDFIEGHGPMNNVLRTVIDGKNVERAITDEMFKVLEKGFKSLAAFKSQTSCD